MAKNKIKDVKQPDAFITTADKVGQFLVHHLKWIVTLVIIFVVGGSGYIVQKKIHIKTEKTAANELYTIEQKLNKKQKELNKKSKADKTASKKKANVKPKIGDFKKDFAVIASEYETVILKHKKTAASLTAAFQLSQLYFEHKQFPKAQNLLNNIDVSSHKNVLAPLFHMLKATAHNHMKEYEKAVTFYNKVLEDKKATHIHGEAYIKLGLTYMSLNDKEKARENFTLAQNKFSNTEFSKLAKTYLRSLKIN